MGARYHDFNVFTHDKRVEKLRYMHRNPVKAGLVEKPEDYRWSSYRAYALGELHPIRISTGHGLAAEGGRAFSAINRPLR